MVNPIRIVEPTVGWKRAPLSAVALTSGVISDKCFTSCILKIHMLTYMLINYEIVNDYSIRLSVQCFDKKG